MLMYGAILGDIIGSPYEFDRGEKTKEFELFPAHARFTDDTVMTIAVAEALVGLGTDADEEHVKGDVVRFMRHWGSSCRSSRPTVRCWGWLSWLSRKITVSCKVWCMR